SQGTPHLAVTHTRYNLLKKRLETKILRAGIGFAFFWQAESPEGWAGAGSARATGRVSSAGDMVSHAAASRRRSGAGKPPDDGRSWAAAHCWPRGIMRRL